MFHGSLRRSPLRDERRAVHLVLDEADLWAPQRPIKGWEGLLGHIEEIVRRGRPRSNSRAVSFQCGSLPVPARTTSMSASAPERLPAQWQGDQEEQRELDSACRADPRGEGSEPDSDPEERDAADPQKAVHAARTEQPGESWYAAATRNRPAVERAWEAGQRNPTIAAEINRFETTAEQRLGGEEGVAALLRGAHEGKLSMPGLEPGHRRTLTELARGLAFPTTILPHPPFVRRRVQRER
jgi:hypothetical protein